MRYELEVSGAGAPPYRVRLAAGDTLRVGRSSQCEIPIEAEGVRRFHLEILAAEDGCRLRRAEGDVQVDGRPAPEGALEVEVPDGAEVRLGALDGPMLRIFRLAGQAPVEGEFLLEARRVSIGRIREADLAVSRGEVVAILGRSGSGKTTLLACLARRIEESAGEVRLAGAGRVAFVAQEDSLYEELSPRQILHYAARLQHASPEIARALVDELEMGSFADRRAGKLSGGQRRRVTIATALVGSPDLLFLDEPDSGLDPYHAQRLMGLLRDLADRRRIGIVLTTHSLLHQKLIDRVLVLDDRGRVRAQGTPAAVAEEFRVQDLHRIYQRLEHDEREPEAPVRAERYGEPRRTAGPRRLPSAARLAALVERGLVRKVVEAGSVRAALLLPLAVALSIRLVWWTWPPLARADQADLAMPLLGWIASIWLGLTASVQSIVSERAHYRHERSFGVLDVEYVAARTAVLAVLLAGQVLLLTAILAWRTTLAPGVLLAGAASGAASGMVLGLAISALSSAPEVALRLVPVLMIPQILFSRLTGFPLEDRTPWFAREVLSRLAFTPHLEAIFGSPEALTEGFDSISGWTGPAGQLAGLAIALAGMTFVGLWLQDRRERTIA